jgi:hypothetical protein
VGESEWDLVGFCVLRSITSLKGSCAPNMTEILVHVLVWWWECTVCVLLSRGCVL